MFCRKYTVPIQRVFEVEAILFHESVLTDCKVLSSLDRGMNRPKRASLKISKNFETNFIYKDNFQKLFSHTVKHYFIRSDSL
jgi:hypothetical protein